MVYSYIFGSNELKSAMSVDQLLFITQIKEICTTIHPTSRV